MYQSQIKNIIDRVDWTEEKYDSAWTAIHEIIRLIYPDQQNESIKKGIQNAKRFVIQ